MQPTKFKINYDINLKTKEFSETVDKIIKDFDITDIFETGTYNGLGSTTVFAKTGKYVVTVEANYTNFITAIKNLAEYQNVCVVHALSLDRETLIKTLMETKFDVETTYDSKFPKTFYLREVIQSVVLEDALNLFVKNELKQLIFLDSAGGVGFEEFKEVMAMNLKNKVLMLDDIDHFKHVQSVKYLEENGYQVNKSSDNRFAWCVLNK